MPRFDQMHSIAFSLAVITAFHSAANGQKPDKPRGGDPDPTAAELNPALAFVTNTNGRHDVVVAAADIASEIVLTQSVQFREKGVWRYTFGSPAWSPDGSMVAFGALLWYGSSDNRTRTQLFIAKADGSQVTLIRDFRDRPTLHSLYHHGGLSWSPTGAEIVYEGNHAVVAIEVATGDINVLLDGFYTGDPVGQPALSPDLDPADGYQGELAVRGLDGSIDADGTPQWDIYTAQLSTDSDGYLLPINPATIANATNAPGTNEIHPSWSPDGQVLACFHDDGTDQWLATIDMSTGVSTLVWPDYATYVNGEDRVTWTSDARHCVSDRIQRY